MPLCERIELLPDQMSRYRVGSRSTALVWHIVSIDLDTGIVDCDCNDFRYNRTALAHSQGHEDIDIGNTSCHCYHIERAINDCLHRKPGDGNIILTLPQHKPFYKGKVLETYDNTGVSRR